LGVQPPLNVFNPLSCACLCVLGSDVTPTDRSYRKILNFSCQRMNLFKAQNASKPVFGRSSVPDSAGDSPGPDHLIGWGGGYPFPIPIPSTSLVSRSRRLRRLASDPILFPHCAQKLNSKHLNMYFVFFAKLSTSNIFLIRIVVFAEYKRYLLVYVGVGAHSSVNIDNVTSYVAGTGCHLDDTSHSDAVSHAIGAIRQRRTTTRQG